MSDYISCKHYFLLPFLPLKTTTSSGSFKSGELIQECNWSNMIVVYYLSEKVLGYVATWRHW